MYVPVSLTHNMSTSTSSMRLLSFPSSHYILQQCVEVFFLIIVAGGDNWAKRHGNYIGRQYVSNYCPKSKMLIPFLYFYICEN